MTKKKTKGIVFNRAIIIDPETGERKFENITPENEHLIDHSNLSKKTKKKK
jgi:hypothetical protein